MDCSGKSIDDDVNYDNFGGGGFHHNNESLLEIAAKICEATDRGDTSCANSLLDNTIVHAVLDIFHQLTGHRTRDNNLRSYIPLCVKAHLMLRAFLHCSNIVTPWDAAYAAIQSMQFTINAQKPFLSHGEELAMISELRSYIINLRTVQYNSGDTDDDKDPVFVIDRLVDLGDKILAPLRRDCGLSTSNDDDDWGIDNYNTARRKKTTKRFIFATSGVDTRNPSNYGCTE